MLVEVSFREQAYTDLALAMLREVRASVPGPWVRVDALASRMRNPPRRGTVAWQEIMDKSRPEQPELANVLYSLVMDANCVRYGQTLSDFGKDFGFTDLQDGVKAWEGCHASWQGLTRLGLDLDKLDEIMQEWDS